MPNHAYDNIFPVQVHFMEMKLVLIWKVLHQELFWYRGKSHSKMASRQKVKHSLMCIQQSLVMMNILWTRIKYWPRLSVHLLIKMCLSIYKMFKCNFLTQVITTWGVSLTAKQNYNIQFYKNLREKKIISITKELGSLTSCLQIFCRIISKQFINQTSTHVIFKITPEVSICQLLFHIVSL